MIGRFLALPGRCQFLLLEAAVLVFCVRAALWLMPYRLVSRYLSHGPEFSRRGSLSSAKVAWAISVVSRYIPTATCLTQALAARALLRLHGHESAIQIGVARKNASELEAHAWVEAEGKIILGNNGVEKFTPLRPGVGVS